MPGSACRSASCGCWGSRAPRWTDKREPENVQPIKQTMWLIGPVAYFYPTPKQRLYLKLSLGVLHYSQHNPDDADNENDQFSSTTFGASAGVGYDFRLAKSRLHLAVLHLRRLGRWRRDPGQRQHRHDRPEFQPPAVRREPALPVIARSGFLPAPAVPAMQRAAADHGATVTCVALASAGVDWGVGTYAAAMRCDLGAVPRRPRSRSSSGPDQPDITGTCGRRPMRMHLSALTAARGIAVAWATSSTIVLAACGGGDTSGIDPATAPRSIAMNAWTPGPNDTCTREIHDQYAVVGPDGKLYPTWHPAVDPATGCTFGHDHGRDPQRFRPVRRERARSRSATPTSSWRRSIPANPRNEDHVGHKIEWANDVQLHRGRRAASRSPVTCSPSCTRARTRRTRSPTTCTSWSTT